MRIFKRKIYKELEEWKRLDSGTSALLVKGARRVGKSTIVEEFAKREYETYIVVNFVKCSPDIRELFDDISNLDYIFMRLQMAYHVVLKPRKSVIILDEIQFCPKARQAIKFLVEDNRYDYIETGSLISIRKYSVGIQLPSEERSIDMYPMDFEEFKWALGDEVSMTMLRQSFLDRKSLGDAVNRQMMRDFRIYMAVGGMPQAVSTYLETNNLEIVDSRKRAIINLYENDFNNFDPSGMAAEMFHNIPAQLYGNANRYRTWSVTAQKWDEDIDQIVGELRKSMTVNISRHANDPNAGLAMHQDLRRFKMFAGDTGLFVTLAFWDKKFTDNEIYKKIFSDKLQADLGYVYENAVAQMLVAAGHQLYYYTFQTPSGNHNYEIDFLIADGTKISPIEVKSSDYRTHKSLDAFCEKFSSRVAREYVIYSKDLRKDGPILYLPMYMTPFL